MGKHPTPKDFAELSVALGGLLLFVALGYAVYLLYDSYRYRKIAAQGVTLQATVTSKDSRSNHTGKQKSIDYTVVLAYTFQPVSGEPQPVRVKESVSATLWRKLSVGEQTEVAVYPDAPDKPYLLAAYLPENRPLMERPLTVFICLLVALGLIGLGIWLRR